MSLDYTKTIATSDMKLIWFETEPAYNADGMVDEASADYSVVGIAKLLNNVVYALKMRAKSSAYPRVRIDDMYYLRIV